MSDGKVKEAIRAYRQTLKFKPDYAEVHYHLGLAYRSSGQEDKAIAEMVETLKYRPDFSEARHSLADIYRGQGRYGEAIKEYKILNDGASGALSYILGITYLDKWQEYRDREDLKQAQLYFRQTLKNDPEHPEVQTKLQLVDNLLDYKIQLLLVSSPALKRVKEICEHLKNKMPYDELSRIPQSYPAEVRMIFSRPDELDGEIKNNLQKLENGQMSDILRDGSNYAVIYRINSL